MTVPRDLSLERIGDKFFVRSMPAAELNKLSQQQDSLENIDASNFDLTSRTGKISGPAELNFSSDQIENFTITLSNNQGEKLLIGYDKSSNNYFIDRTQSGFVSFEKDFAAKHTAPRISGKSNVQLTLIIDDASVELFADNGLSVMTEIFFPKNSYSSLGIQSPDHLKIKSLKFEKLKSMYE